MTLLEATREALGPAPRRMRLRLRDVDRSTSEWLADQGEVKLAVAVWTANSLLVPSPNHGRVLAIHPPPGAPDVDLLELYDIANVLGSLGPMQREPDMAAMVQILQHAPDVQQHGIPIALTAGRKLVISTIHISNADLPTSFLASTFFPVFVHEKSKFAVLLPSRFWADDLRLAWLDLSADL